jgi:hypothetical protein
MKKILIAATAALCFASSSFAQENAGGEAASNSAFGEMNKETIIAGVVGVGILGAMIANNRGNSKTVIIEETPTCDGSDPLVNGVCTGTTNTVTVSGTGTTFVPVTFTYLPTL